MNVSKIELEQDFAIAAKQLFKHHNASKEELEGLLTLCLDEAYEEKNKGMP